MVKENTHIALATAISERLPDGPLKKLLSDNQWDYFVGSVVPDAGYYGDAPELEHLADSLHGTKGENTDLVTKHLIQRIKSPSEEKSSNYPRFAPSTAFLMGYLTHAIADRVIHPIINHFAGNFANQNKKAAKNAWYKHRLFETWLDTQWSTKKDRMYIHTRTESIKHTLFAEYVEETFGIDQDALQNAFTKQKLRARQFLSPMTYAAVKLAKQPKEILALFYGHLKKNSPAEYFENSFSYLHPITGEKHTTTLDTLRAQIITEGTELLQNVYAYIEGERKHIDDVLTGASFDTGVVGKGMQDTQEKYMQPSLN